MKQSIHTYVKRKTRKWKPATGIQRTAAWLFFITVLVLLLLSKFVFLHQTSFLIHLVLLYAQIVFFIVFIRLKRKGPHLSIGVWISSLEFVYTVLYLSETYRYEFYSSSGFFWISLILATIVAVILTIVTANVTWKNLKWGLRIGCFASAVLFLLFFILIPLGHLNYALDAEAPQKYIAVIESKHTHHNRRSLDSYMFRITIAGETFSLQVPPSDYYMYNVGDTYTFYRYEGAFGKPFYLAE